MATYTFYASFDRVCFYIWLFTITVRCQEPISSGSRYYGRDGVYVPSNGPNHPTDTYIYKDRRYGYRPSYLDPIYKGPTRPSGDRYHYEVTSNTVKVYIRRVTIGFARVFSKIYTFLYS